MKYELINDPDGECKVIDKNYEEWIRNAGEGAYTTVRVLDANRVFMFEMQIDRLYNTLYKMLGGKTDDVRLDKVYLKTMVSKFIHKTCSHLKERLARSYIHLPLTGGIRVASEAIPTGRSFSEGKLVPIIRNTPGIKSTNWIDARSTVHLPPHTEGLITNGGNIYEGFSSSFFVFKKNSSGKIVVQTANENILMGTMRVLILDVCKELDYEIDLSFPKEAEIDTWISAGISSTSRGFEYFDKIIDEKGIVHDIPYEVGSLMKERVDKEMETKYEMLKF